MRLDELPTPALVVDLDRLQGNVDSMQAMADEAGVGLRPHAKTHKSPHIAQMQSEAGAIGLTVATVDEAEAFASSGFGDLLLATPITSRVALHRLRALNESGAEIQFTVDTLEGAAVASEVFKRDPVRVLIEVDTGHGRNGVTWDDPNGINLVSQIAALPGLLLGGVLTYAGQVYMGPRAGETLREALERVADDERERLLAFAVRLGEVGILSPNMATVAAGSTPTSHAFEQASRGEFRITEIHPGNYVFGDAEQVALGTMNVRDCSLTCRATVVSTKVLEGGRGRFIIDAGKKILSSDRPHGVDTYGLVLADDQISEAQIIRLSEEHGVVESSDPAAYAIGDSIVVLPGRANTAVATRDVIHLTRDGEYVSPIQIV